MISLTHHNLLQISHAGWNQNLFRAKHRLGEKSHSEGGQGEQEKSERMDKMKTG